MPPSFTTRVLEIVQRLPLFLSPYRQPFVICPSSATATPIYAEAFYAWLTFAPEKQLGSLPVPNKSAASSANSTTTPAPPKSQPKLTR